MMITLTFALVGLVYVLRNLRSSACRTILIALLVSPAAGALVQISLTRVLIFVVPMAILTAIGLEKFLLWLEDPGKRLTEASEGAEFTSWRIAGALLILVIELPLGI